jgi:hypothetical protein
MCGRPFRLSSRPLVTIPPLCLPPPARALFAVSPPVRPSNAMPRGPYLRAFPSIRSGLSTAPFRLRAVTRLGRATSVGGSRPRRASRIGAASCCRAERSAARSASTSVRRCQPPRQLRRPPRTYQQDDGREPVSCSLILQAEHCETDHIRPKVGLRRSVSKPAAPLSTSERAAGFTSADEPAPVRSPGASWQG